MKPPRSIQSIVRDIIVEQVGLDEDKITSNSNFIEDLGTDSLDIVELVMAFEEEFGMKMPDEDAEKLDTVGKVVQYIEQKIGDELFNQEDVGGSSSIIGNVTEELKRYFAKHPEKLRDLDPRKFEELVADILKDFGFDTEMTSVSRDGGRDVYAYMRNAITSFLLFVECKRWTPPNHVGIDIVQRMYGASRISRANKGMIVTTSFFTGPAKREQRAISTELELVDYEGLKMWLKRYR